MQQIVDTVWILASIPGVGNATETDIAACRAPWAASVCWLPWAGGSSAACSAEQTPIAAAMTAHGFAGAHEAAQSYSCLPPIAHRRDSVHFTASMPLPFSCRTATAP